MRISTIGVVNAEVLAGLLEKHPHQCNLDGRVVPEVAHDREEDRTRQTDVDGVWIWGHGICSASSHVAGPRLTGFGLHRTSNVGFLFPGRRHPHSLPVIRKLLAAIQADDVCASLGSPGTPPSPPAGQGEGRALVPASEQSVENCHLFLLINMGSNGPDPSPGQKKPARPFAYLSSAVKPEFVSLVFLLW